MSNHASPIESFFPNHPQEWSPCREDPNHVLDARILLISDQDSTRRVLAARLRARGAEVLSAGDIADALERLSRCQRRGRAIDLVVAHVDKGDAYQLTGLAGIQALAPVVAISAHPVAGACLNAGCSAFCEMPIDLEEFVISCVSALDARMLQTEEAANLHPGHRRSA